MSQSKASGRKSVAGMGSIRKKEKVINGKAYTYYEARYTVGIDPGTGKQIQKSISGKTQREVTRRLKEITTSIDTGTYLPSCKLTVGEWLNTWISEYTADWKPLTVSNYSKQIKKHLIPRLSAAKLEDLDTHTIQLFYNSLKIRTGTENSKEHTWCPPCRIRAGNFKWLYSQEPNRRLQTSQSRSARNQALGSRGNRPNAEGSEEGCIR